MNKLMATNQNLLVAFGLSSTIFFASVAPSHSSQSAPLPPPENLSKSVTVACFIPGTHEAPKEYLGRSKVIYNFKKTSYSARFWDTESNTGATIRFLEPVETQKQLKKIQKNVAYRQEKLAQSLLPTPVPIERKAKTSRRSKASRHSKPLPRARPAVKKTSPFLSKPMDPSAIFEQYVFEVTVESKHKKHFQPNAWQFEVQIEAGSKRVSRYPKFEWITLKPFVSKESIGIPLGSILLGSIGNVDVSLGGDVKLSKDIFGLKARLYSGVKFNPNISAVTVLVTNPEGDTGQVRFDFRYGMLPNIYEDMTGGNKGRSQKWTWEELPKK